jgi:hypothetical protein
MRLALMTVASISLLVSCGQSSPRRHFEKQNSPSTIKITSLDLENNRIQLRFDYRSYYIKILTKMDCMIKLNNQSTLNINQIDSIELGAFSTETLNFDITPMDQIKTLLDGKSIDYDINCNINYNKGSEFLSESSVLHLVPSEQFLYR